MLWILATQPSPTFRLQAKNTFWICRCGRRIWSTGILLSGTHFDVLEQTLINTLPTLFYERQGLPLIRKTFHLLDGFDESYFMHQRNWFVLAAFNHGFTSKAISEAVVYHVGGATLPNSPKRCFTFKFALSLTKNAPKGQLFPLVFLRLLLDGIAGLVLLKGDCSVGNDFKFLVSALCFNSWKKKFTSKKRIFHYQKYRLGSFYIKKSKI